MTSKKPTVDTHCHLMNFDYLPDKYSKHLLKNMNKKAAKYIEEEEIKGSFFHGIIMEILGRFSGKKLIAAVNSLKSENFWGIDGVIDNLVKKGEFLTTNDIKKMDLRDRLRDVDIYVPLMMDFITGSNITKVHNSDGVKPYVMQLQDIAHISRSYPWQIFPFFAFHPKRENVLSLCKLAIEKNGFIGVKMYPAMGFYPDFRGYFGEKNDKIDPQINKNLEGLYNFIQEKREKGIVIPINAHSQYYSTQSIDLKYEKAKLYTDVENWFNLIRDYNLKINFAHFGGIDYLKSSWKEGNARSFSEETRDKITYLMKNYNNNDNKLIFADLAAHSFCLKEDTEKNKDIMKKYFEDLNSHLEEGLPLMYGTDLPVITNEMSAKDYINAYEENIKDQYKEDFFSKNALKFLFNNKTIPMNYLNFMRNSYEEGLMDKDPFSREIIDQHSWIEDYIAHNTNILISG